jgi:hypothetical protein
MLPLDAEFRVMLLAQHQPIRRADDENQLTPVLLEQYDAAVGQHYALRQRLYDEIDRSEAPATPAGRRTIQIRRDDSSSNRLKQIEGALEPARDPVNNMLSNCMPDFRYVHARWGSWRQTRELRQANLAYRRIRLRKGGLNHPAIFIGLIAVVEIISLVALLPK